MNIAVCVKQIPDPNVPGKLDVDNTLDRSGKPQIDDSDMYGVEMALQLADKAGGGDVNPEQWTHGSSAERARWFTTGYNASDIDECDTFAASSL